MKREIDQDQLPKLWRYKLSHQLQLAVVCVETSKLHDVNMAEILLLVRFFSFFCDAFLGSSEMNLERRAPSFGQGVGLLQCSMIGG